MQGRLLLREERHAERVLVIVLLVGDCMHGQRIDQHDARPHGEHLRAPKVARAHAQRDAQLEPSVRRARSRGGRRVLGKDLCTARGWRAVQCGNLEQPMRAHCVQLQLRRPA